MTSQLTGITSALKTENFYTNFSSWANQIATLIIDCNHKKQLVTLFGNGGSAADAQHWAAELTCTYKIRSRQPYAALALTTDNSILTAWSNDFQFSTVFQRQIEAFKNLNGLSLGLSTSGNSLNVLNALNTANKLGAHSVLISGSSCDIISSYDLHIRLPSTDTPIIQTLTQMLYHEVCEHLEEQ